MTKPQTTKKNNAVKSGKKTSAPKTPKKEILVELYDVPEGDRDAYLEVFRILNGKKVNAAKHILNCVISRMDSNAAVSAPVQL